MTKKNIGLLLAGLGIGAAAAILYAPRSGKVTRRFIRAKGNNLKTAAIDGFERGKKGLAGTKEQLAAAIEAGREAYRDAKAL